MTEGDRQTRSGSDPAFDAAIDRAVRDMMSVDAPAGFRSRVLTRIEKPAPRAFPWFRLAAGSLAAAVLAAFVLVRSRDTGTGTRPPEGPNAPAVAAVSPSERTPSTGTTPTGHPVREDQSVAPGGVQRPRVVAATAIVAEAAPAFEIAPLDTIQPIAIAPIQPRSMAPAALSIDPLAPIVEVQVEPLSPPRGQL